MKKIFSSLFLAIAMGAPYSVAQQLTLDASALQGGAITVNQSAMQVVKSKITALAEDQSEPTDSVWRTCDGSWVYVSNYTKQTYPTTVRKRVMTYESYGDTLRRTLFEISNSLFGKAYLLFNPSGYIDLYDKDGASRVNLLDDDGQPTNNYVSAGLMPKNVALANVMQYAASENIEISLNLSEKNEDTGYYIVNYITYDYLYNTEAQPAKIDVEMPRLVKSPFSIDGRCGSGVSDLYYVLALSKRNELKAEEFPELAETGLPVNCETIPVMLSEYISTGKLNPAIKIEKVTIGETGEFTVNVKDEWEGMRGVSLIALKDGEICDQKYVDIEMRGDAGWKAYKTADITLSIPAAMTEDNQDKFIDKKTVMEINESAKLIRIRQPYGNFASDYNYIYLDYSLGMDKCFMTSSYTPNTYTYTYYKSDMTESLPVSLPYYCGSFVTANQKNGLSLESIYSIGAEYGWFFDLSSEVPSLNTILQDENRYLYTDVIYVVGYSTMTITISEVAGVDFNDRYVLNVTMGSDVAKVEFSFVNLDNPSVCSQTYNIENAGATFYTFDIVPELINSRIPKTVNSVKFTFFDKSGTVIKSGDMALTLDLSVDFAELSFEQEINANTSGYRRCSYETFPNGNTLITLYDFFDSYYYTGASYGGENTLEIVVLVDNTLMINPSYFGKLNFTGLGLCDVRTYTEDNSLIDNIVKADMYWYVYSDDVLMGYWQMSPVTITLPKHYVGTSAIEDVEFDLEADRDVPAEYFNLQGQRITNPSIGNIYIERKAGRVRKILY